VCCSVLPLTRWKKKFSAVTTLSRCGLFIFQDERFSTFLVWFCAERPIVGCTERKSAAWMYSFFVFCNVWSYRHHTNVQTRRALRFPCTRFACSFVLFSFCSLATYKCVTENVWTFLYILKYIRVQESSDVQNSFDLSFFFSAVFCSVVLLFCCSFAVLTYWPCPSLKCHCSCKVVTVHMTVEHSYVPWLSHGTFLTMVFTETLW